MSHGEQAIAHDNHDGNLVHDALRLFAAVRSGNVTITAPDGFGNGTNFEDGGKPISFANFLDQQRVIHDVAVASLTLYAWEFFTTIPQEWSLYRHRKLLSPQVILFAAVRYLAVPALVLPAYSAFNDFSNDPDGCLLHQQLSIVPVQAAVAAIFSWRTCAIWGWAPKIKWGLLALFLAQIGSSFALLWYSGQKLLPTGACMPVAKPNSPNTLAWFYVTALIFDGITVGLSLWRLLALSQSGGPEEHTVRARDLCSPWILAKKLRCQWTTMTPLLGRLVTSGLVYLFVASAFNLINFALEISNWIHAKALIPLYAPLMAILGQRTVLVEAEAVYGRGRGSTADRNRSLVERVLREGRKSWEGSFVAEPAAAQTPRSPPANVGRSQTSSRSRPAHLTLNLDSTTSEMPTQAESNATSEGAHLSRTTTQVGHSSGSEKASSASLTFAAMLDTPVTDADARPKRTRTNGGSFSKLREALPGQRGRSNSRCSAKGSPSQSPNEVSAGRPVLSPAARALALQMAGLDIDTSSGRSTVAPGHDATAQLSAITASHDGDADASEAHSTEVCGAGPPIDR